MIDSLLRVLSCNSLIFNEPLTTMSMSAPLFVLCCLHWLGLVGGHLHRLFATISNITSTSTI